MSSVSLIPQAAKNLLSVYRETVDAAEQLLLTAGTVDELQFDSEFNQVKIDLLVKYYEVDADTITSALLS